MADHLWFAPVAGGGAPQHTIQSVYNEFEFEPEINVQWTFSAYPTSTGAAEACVRPGTVTSFSHASGPSPSVEPAKLTSCDGKWQWRSCADDQSVTVGGQLSVGTVFSRELANYIHGVYPAIVASPNYTWDTVEAWVKFQVSSITTISGIYFVINDRAGNTIGLGVAPVDWLAGLPVAANTWTVIKAFKWGGWTEWDDDNLRATLSILGTDQRANVGDIRVHVEWFAFRLSDDELPPP